MSGRRYVHIRVHLPTEDGRETKRTLWAYVVKPGRVYRVVAREGQEKSWERPDGVIVEQEHYLLIEPQGIIYERPAHVSQRYGWLVEGKAS